MLGVPVRNAPKRTQACRLEASQARPPALPTTRSAEGRLDRAGWGMDDGSPGQRMQSSRVVEASSRTVAARPSRKLGGCSLSLTYLYEAARLAEPIPQESRCLPGAATRAAILRLQPMNPGNRPSNDVRLVNNMGVTRLDRDSSIRSQVVREACNVQTAQTQKRLRPSSSPRWNVN